jgi:uncharacterized membrane protein YoaK (UPF0700 family)
LISSANASSELPNIFDRHSRARDGARIILSAVAMGLQAAVGRVMQIPGIPTTVITSTLTAIIAALAERVLNRERPVQRSYLLFTLSSHSTSRRRNEERESSASNARIS